MSFSSSPIREPAPAIFRHMQPSSPTHYDEDLPSDVDISFASSMSISMSPAPPERHHHHFQRPSYPQLQTQEQMNEPVRAASRPMLSPIMDASPMDISPVPTPFLQVPKRPALATIQPVTSTRRENIPPKDYFALPAPSTKSRHQTKSKSQESPFSLPPARKFGTDIRNIPRSEDYDDELKEGSEDLRSSKGSRTRGSLPAHWVQGAGSAEKRMGGLFEPDGWDVNHGLPSSSPARCSDRMDIDSSSPAVHQSASATNDTYMSPPPAVMTASASNLSDLSGLYESSDLPSSPLAQPRLKKPSPPSKSKSSLLLAAPSSDLPSSSPPTSPTVALKSRKLDKFATAGPGSFHFRGLSSGSGGIPSLSSTRARAHPYAHARRPSINPSAPDRERDAHGRPLPAPQSAFSILTQDPEGLRAPGPPMPVGPMRRALSMAASAPQDASSDDIDSECASPLMAAQRAYAKRTHTRLVTRADGSAAFRPLRPDGGDSQPVSAIEPSSSSSNSISKRESCPVQPSAGLGLPFGGFGHNEQEGKILPCHKVKDDGLMRITPDTLEAVLNGDYDSHLAALHIVDCRFDYEYAGGHIDGAVNLGTTDAVEDYFLRAGCGLALPSPSRSGEIEQGEKKTVIIFHCEFSVKRAPTIAKYLRSRDRALNAHVYPKVHFPEIYVLQGGYYDFFKRCPTHCEPKGYVAMLDPRHAGACSPSLGQFRQGSRWQRARSYTYGDHTLQRPKSITQPPVPPLPLPLPLPFAAPTSSSSSSSASTAAAAAGAVSKKRRAALQLTSVREDHSSSEDTFGTVGESPCARMIAPPCRGPLSADPSNPKSLGRNVFERAVSFR